MIEFIAMMGKLLCLLIIKAYRSMKLILLEPAGYVVPPMPKKTRPPAPKPRRPPFQLTPDTKGTYNLERWDGESEIYLRIKSGVKDLNEAEEYVKNLERPIISF
jgi:hypothetical protein